MTGEATPDDTRRLHRRDVRNPRYCDTMTAEYESGKRTIVTVRKREGWVFEQ